MAAIRSRNTRAELLLRQALRERELTGYRCHHPGLPGKPDIVFTRWRVAIFVDGAYWHGHPDHFTFGRLGQYWDEKIRRTQQRDGEQAEDLHLLGYVVLRFWDFEIKADVKACVAAVELALTSRGRSLGIAESGSSPSRGWGGKDSDHHGLEK
jgi:DNA mismatch endonuclease (patch repair protein)